MTNQRGRAAVQAKQQRRLRTILIVAVLAAVVVGGIVIQAARSTSDRPDRTPSGTFEKFAFADGPATAPVTIEVYEDFLCPACGAFEAQSGELLKRLADSGEARVVYRPMSFLDEASTTDYSTRALNALGCVVDADPELAVPMHEQLFRVQPPEGGPGLSDDRLIRLGERVGVADDGFAQCVNDLAYERWTEKATEAASRAGVVGTPTVLVNGKHLEVPTAVNLQAAVDQAAG